MTNWPVKTLGDVCDVIAGQSPEGKFYNKEGKGVPFYQGKKDFAERVLGSPTTWTSEVTKLAQPGDILMSVRAPVGPVNLCPIEACIGRGLAAIRPSSKTDTDFIYYYLESIQSEIAGTEGAVFASINKAQIEGLRCPVPPLDEQKRIVELLDAATERVTELTACYEQARTHANNLFASALREALESNPDWPIKTLGQVATFHNGRAYKQQELLDKGKYRVLRVGNFFSSKSWYWSDLELDEHKYCDKGDLLYAWSASFGPRIWDEEKVIYHYHIWKVVEESQQINRQFLKYWLEEDVERVKSASGTGTTMMHVSKGNIEARLISLPPLEEQKRIVARLDSMRAKTSEMVDAYDAKLNAAKNLRQSILEAAFAGDL